MTTDPLAEALRLARRANKLSHEHHIPNVAPPLNLLLASRHIIVQDILTPP